ncbi:E3 ubiquitin-protein ligase Siah2 isoform X2 [Folsomia candida]|uniref:E3 ubiquitin-protein ligase Siah2 isoform X2 n=1 Tax=Folsomia candida TaxID=158441 RepID=UPI0016050CD1|nr:E3 ubiquitin-protein ligase Siah2 isoform X2 [Folsomia candida]
MSTFSKMSTFFGFKPRRNCECRRSRHEPQRNGRDICNSCGLYIQEFRPNLERLKNLGPVASRNQLDNLDWIDTEEDLDPQLVFEPEVKSVQKVVPPSKPGLSDALECTICLDPAASPINHCDNGHIVCGFCVERMTECGLCKTKLTPSVLAERLSRQLDLTCNCPNFSSGCVVPFAAAEVKNHVKECYYRNVICDITWQHKCDKIEIPFEDFAMHLLSTHGTNLYTIIDGMRASEPVTFPLDGDNFAYPGASGIYRILKKNGETFFLHFHTTKKFDYLWVTVLGDAKEAEKHWFNLKISHTSDTRRQGATLP